MVRYNKPGQASTRSARRRFSIRANANELTDYGDGLPRNSIGRGPALSLVQKDSQRDEDDCDDPQNCAFAAAFLVSHVQQYTTEPNRASSAVINSGRGWAALAEASNASPGQGLGVAVPLDAVPVSAVPVVIRL